MTRQENNTTRVFVYGTLRTGEPNHRLLHGYKPVATLRTAPTFELVNLGAFPGMTRGGSTAVVGEVYEVRAETLVDLDRLEGHPNFYRREAIELEDGREVSAYLLRPADARGYRPIPSGDWLQRKGA